MQADTIAKRRGDNIMFLLLGAVAALITTFFEILFFCRKRTFGAALHSAVRNIFVVDLITAAVFRYILKYDHFLDTSAYGTENFVKFFIVALGVGIIWMLLFAFLNRHLAFGDAHNKKTHGTRFIKLLSCFLFMLGCAAFFGTIWGKDSFGDVTADQLIINLFSPTEGADSGVYLDVFERPVFQTMLCTAVFSIFVYSDFSIVYSRKGISAQAESYSDATVITRGGEKSVTVFGDLAKRIISLLLSVAMLAGGVAYGCVEFDLKQLYNAYIAESSFIEDNYVDPREAGLVFPQQKRNLIHIYAESLENSYLSEELGGHMEQNLMPELTELSKEGVIFSDTENRFGGPQQAVGTQWSVAAMVNMMTGLPMKVPAEQNAYGSEDNFLPGAYTLFDILEDQGYEQTVMFGADANFGGLTYLFGTHGNATLFDYGYAKRNKLIPEDYKVWWGFEDDKLYEFAKDEITRLYNTGKPFNFTMETADTHRPHGYLSEKAPTPYSDHYANAIAYSTSEIVKFVDWIKQQPFYENTTIIIIGDHLSMDTDFFENFDPNYHRTQFNLILNAAPSVAGAPADRFVNRQYCNFDMFPTILSSIGVTIPESRLGIGTDLFSARKTVFEEFGYEYSDNELEKKSEFMNENILKKPAEQAAAEQQ